MQFISLMGSHVGAFMVDTNLFMRIFLNKGINLRRLSDKEKLCYAGPLVKLSNRHSIHLLFRGIVKSEDYLNELERSLANLGHLPLLLVNGDMDNGFKAGFGNRLQKIIPDNGSIVVKGGAHFAVEEAPDQVSDGIRAWCRRLRGIDSEVSR